MPTLTDYQDDLARYTDEAEQYRSRAELARKEHRRREAVACETSAAAREKMIATYLRIIADMTREHDA